MKQVCKALLIFKKWEIRTHELSEKIKSILCEEKSRVSFFYFTIK